MKLHFSEQVDISKFIDINTDKQIYLGFAAEPEKNVFSHKFRGSQFNSSTETVLKNLALLNYNNDSELILHTASGIVTLDIATAAYAIQQPKESLGTENWRVLTDYISKIESGIVFSAFTDSLYAYYYATARMALKYYADNSESRNTFLLETYWKALGSVLNNLSSNNIEFPDYFTRFVAEHQSTASQLVEIKNENNRFFEDYSRAETFELSLPLKNSLVKNQAQYSTVNIISFCDPRSSLLKFYTRAQTQYPDGIERTYPCMYVHNASRKGQVSEHITSVPPDVDFHLKGLANLIERMEDYVHPDRATDNPRSGYDYNDPWYDERHAQYSIIDTPKEGSKLSRHDILEALWFYGCPLRRLKPDFATTSLFIPLWTPDNFKNNSLKNTELWQAVGCEEKVLREFLPYVENIFSNKSNLRSYKYQKEVALIVKPQWKLTESPAVEVIRQEMLANSQAILNKVKVKLNFYQYDYGLGMIEILVDSSDEDISLFDLHWLKYCLSITLLKDLLPIADISSLKPELEHQHFSCSTMTNFVDEVGIFSGKRAVSGLQMMVNNVEPLYKNLPLSISLKESDLVVDETSKRRYLCASTSLLSLNQVGSLQEHNFIHESGRIIFNMILTQRFILSKSRHDVVDAELRHRTEKNCNFGQWFINCFRFKKRNPDEKSISELRSEIQQLTTSSWFNVISTHDANQNIFEKLKQTMKIDVVYKEVQDRCSDLDEAIAKKQNDAQGDVFAILTFVFSPLDLAFGFVGSYQFSQNQPFPFTDFIPNPWFTVAIYMGGFVCFSATLWAYYNWRVFKE